MAKQPDSYQIIWPWSTGGASLTVVASRCTGGSGRCDTTGPMPMMVPPHSSERAASYRRFSAIIQPR